MGARLLALLACSTGCRDEPRPPSWIPLAKRLVVDSPSGQTSSSHSWRDGRNAELVVDRDVTALRIPIERRDWEHVPAQDCWRAPLGLRLTARNGWKLRLETPDGPIPRQTVARIVQGLPLEGFAYFREELLLGGLDGGPPERATLYCEIRASLRNRNGRVVGSDFSGDGISVRAGSSASCTIDVPPRSALRFSTMIDPLLVLPAEVEALIRIRVDGSLVYERRERWHEHSRPVWHRVPLPEEGRTGARLEFEVDGVLTNVAFLDPRIGPREVERRNSRPDIVVFLADTFRADNLAAYGGREGVTPNLDALAARSLCFLGARSVSTWTLPSHASIFSGLFPLQVRSAGGSARVSRGLVTVAERLEAAGYRTAALTDGAYLSSEFGLDQGFAHFSERSRRDLPGKLAEAEDFLAADDGRPVFLFVHTYRVHWPYEASDRTRRELGERLGIRGKASDLLREAFDEAHRQGAPTARHLADLTALSPSPRLVEIASQLRAHYLGSVADLDRDFARFVELLRTSGILDTGYVVFTSDHGEAFAEHGAFFHSGRPFEEQARIPLLIASQSISARNIDHAVSLLDLAPTLLDMAGLAKPPDWPGRSLLSSSPGRPVLCFQASGKPGDTLAVLEQEKKVLCTLGDGDATERRVIGAFDLAVDRKEEHDLAPTAGEWPRALLAKHAALLTLALRPVVGSEAAVLDAQAEDELRALGY